MSDSKGRPVPSGDQIRACMHEQALHLDTRPPGRSEQQTLPDDTGVA